MAGNPKPKTAGATRNVARPCGKAPKKHPKTNKSTGRSVMGIRLDKFEAKYKVTRGTPAFDEVAQRLRMRKREARVYAAQLRRSSRSDRPGIVMSVKEVLALTPLGKYYI